jgi:hypothetical protein
MQVPTLTAPPTLCGLHHPPCELHVVDKKNTQNKIKNGADGDLIVRGLLGAEACQF